MGRRGRSQRPRAPDAVCGTGPPRSRCLGDALAEVGRSDITVVVGGVISPGDFDELYAAGAAAIFPPGTVIVDAATGCTTNSPTASDTTWGDGN
jgi:hypothetical protein